MFCHSNIQSQKGNKGAMANRDLLLALLLVSVPCIALAAPIKSVLCQDTGITCPDQVRPEPRQQDHIELEI